MSDSAERDERFVAGVSRSQRPFLAVGIVLALAGAAYLVWAVARYNPRLDPRDDPGFDRPVAQLAFLFDAYQDRLETTAEGATPRELALMRGLNRNMAFSAGMMVLLVRIFVGTILVVFGLSIMTVVVERARLLAVIGRLRE
jgi:hypothetical protein